MLCMFPQQLFEALKNSSTFCWRLLFPTHYHLSGFVSRLLFMCYSYLLCIYNLQQHRNFSHCEMLNHSNTLSCVPFFIPSAIVFDVLVVDTVGITHTFSILLELAFCQKKISALFREMSKQWRELQERGFHEGTQMEIVAKPRGTVCSLWNHPQLLLTVATRETMGCFISDKVQFSIISSFLCPQQLPASLCEYQFQL